MVSEVHANKSFGFSISATVNISHITNDMGSYALNPKSYTLAERPSSLPYPLVSLIMTVTPLKPIPHPCNRNPKPLKPKTLSTKTLNPKSLKP